MEGKQRVNVAQLASLSLIVRGPAQLEVYMRLECLLWIPLFLLFFGALPARAQTVDFVFSDSEFPDSAWTAVEVIDTTPNDSFTFSGNQLTSGGKPDAYRRIVNSLDTSTASSVAAAHLRVAAVWDPGEEGTFVSLDATFDGISEVGNPAGAVGYAVALMQDGVVYRAGLTPSAVLNGDGWQTLSASGLVASSFCDGPCARTPDLSDSAPPITLGFLTSNGTFGNPSVNVGGVDNWQITIHASPPPVPALGLRGLALVSLCLMIAGTALSSRFRLITSA